MKTITIPEEQRKIIDSALAMMQENSITLQEQHNVNSDDIDRLIFDIKGLRGLISHETNVVLGKSEVDNFTSRFGVDLPMFVPPKPKMVLRQIKIDVEHEEGKSEDFDALVKNIPNLNHNKEYNLEIMDIETETFDKQD